MSLFFFGLLAQRTVLWNGRSSDGTALVGLIDRRQKNDRTISSRPWAARTPPSGLSDGWAVGHSFALFPNRLLHHSICRPLPSLRFDGVLNFHFDILTALYPVSPAARPAAIFLMSVRPTIHEFVSSLTCRALSANRGRMHRRTRMEGDTRSWMVDMKWRKMIGEQEGKSIRKFSKER